MPEHAWTVRVAAGAADRSAVYARSCQFAVGAALSFDEAAPLPSAVEHLLGALGADLVGGLLRAARRLRVEIDRVEATVEGRLNNPLTYLGVVGEEGHPGLQSIKAAVYASCLGSPEQLEAAWRETLARSPLVNTLKSAVELELALKNVL
jgi:hypothetical protein